MENQTNFFTVQDIYDEIDKNVPIDITKIYDPLHFWEDFGADYLKTHKKQKDVQKYVAYVILKLEALKVKSLLDVGCSFGRLEPFLLDSGCVEEITGVDISQKQLDSAEEYLKDYDKKDKIKFEKQSVKNLSFESNSFDCVLSCETLQHMHLPSVRYAIHNMERVAKKYVILIERFIFDGEHSQPHIWSHDYYKLCTNAGFKVLENRLIGNGIIALVLKK